MNRENEYDSSIREFREFGVFIEKFFRTNVEAASRLVEKINDLSNKLFESHIYTDRLKIMNFCGTHEWTVTHYGLRSLLPKTIDLVSGPGCPVCVTPSHYIEEAIKLSLEGVVIYTYGDTYRLNTFRPVKGARSLSEAKALGGSVKLVSNILEAIRDAKIHGKQSVFVGIGFETVAPGYARLIDKNMFPNNFSLMCLVKLTPPAMFYTLDILREKPIDAPIAGVIAPGHVSTITGGKAWAPVAENYGIPVVVSGFEPLDVLLSIVEILEQILQGRAEVFVEYSRAVSWHGDLGAQRLIHKVFETIDDAWRGIGFIPKSGFRIREKYRLYDAFYQYSIREITPENWSRDLPPGCRCAEVTLGKAKPTDCPLFMKFCNPSKPIGPCMVSIEGTCSIWAKHGGEGLAEDIAREAGLK
ncbi:MAG: hydrogenase formation protein HypD [Desulfurococcaceae archaeon]